MCQLQTAAYRYTAVYSWAGADLSIYPRSAVILTKVRIPLHVITVQKRATILHFNLRNHTKEVLAYARMTILRRNYVGLLYTVCRPRYGES